MDPRPASLLAALETPDGYRRSFMDPLLWQPFVRRVCTRNGFPCRAIRPGLAGSFPTFIVDQQLVIKFFGVLFEGGTGWRVEKEAADLMADLPEIPAAPLLASGRLENASGWRYLVFAFLPGASFGELREQVSFPDMLALARWLGTALRRLHAVKLPIRTAIPRLTSKKLRTWSASRKRESLPGWPEGLRRQVDGYLAAGTLPVKAGANHFIHADLTADHLLGELENGTWKTRGIIDFGDALRGNIFYELAALHLDLFAGDRRLLAAFLETYRLSPEDRQDFPRKAMSMALMHQFDIFAPLFARQPRLTEIRTLEELAVHLWEVSIDEGVD